MGKLDRNALLKKEELVIEKVPLGKGDYVYVREMFAWEAGLYEAAITQEVVDEKTGEVSYKRDPANFRAKLAVFTVCDEKGALLLQPEDAEALSRSIGARKLNKIADVALKLNNMAENAPEALVKNSEGGTAADSSSA
jgi:hypothetical protein